jgi:hypothetical protein
MRRSTAVFSLAGVYVCSLSAALTALLLPSAFRTEWASTATTCPQRRLTISRLSHASPHAQKGRMTHLC